MSNPSSTALIVKIDTFGLKKPFEAAVAGSISQLLAADRGLSLEHLRELLVRGSDAHLLSEGQVMVFPLKILHHDTIILELIHSCSVV